MLRNGKCATLFAMFFLVLMLWPAGPCAAADIEKLERRIEELEQQVDALKEALEQTREQQLREPRPEEIADQHVEPEIETTEDEDGVDIGGALRFTYAYRDFSDDSEDKGGDLEFDIFRLNVDGQYKNVLISAEYRWYSYQDVIHHGWVGYDFGESWQAQLGVTQVPFGLLPYASHNWWFAVPYYLGFEDDYDLGLKTIWDRDGWNLQLAFFKNGEYGNSSRLERYSYDVVSDLQDNEETNQFNARIARTLTHGGFGATELGLSGQWGQLYNSNTDGHGDMWAAAAHVNGTYGPFNVMLQAMTYDYSPENPDGVDGDTIEMGAFGVSSLVASEGEIYLAGVSYDVPVEWGPISKLTFYNDYSILDKDAVGPDSQINTTGCLITAGPVYTYIDFILGKNAQFLGGGDNPFGAADDSDDEWNKRFNVNVGYYF